MISPDNAKPQSNEEKKEIFFELTNSDCHFSGPFEDTHASYSNITNVLCSDDVIINNDNEEENTCIESTLQEEISLFNAHPFRRLKFPKPESYDLPDIAYFVSLRLSQLGYCVLDGVFEDNLISGIISEVTEFHQKNELCRGNILHSSSGVDYRNDKIKWLDGQSGGVKNISKGLAYVDTLVELLQPHVKTLCNVEGRTEVS